MRIRDPGGMHDGNVMLNTVLRDEIRRKWNGEQGNAYRVFCTPRTLTDQMRNLVREIRDKFRAELSSLLLEQELYEGVS